MKTPKQKESGRLFKQTPKGKRCKYIENAKIRGYAFCLTLEEFTTIISKPCHYCGKGKSNGIDRVNNFIGYETGNCVPCCKDCNIMKRNYSYTDFTRNIKSIYENLNL